MSRHLGIFLLVASILLSPVAAAEERWRTGTAYDLSTGQLLYREYHLETLVAGKIAQDDVRYVHADGQALAAKRVDFGHRAQTPEFELVDVRTGHREGLRLNERGEYVVTFRRSDQGAPRSQTLQNTDRALADAGFDRFIETSWDQLVAGEALVRQFLVPSELTFFEFRIRQLRTDDDDTNVTFVMEANNLLLRMLTPAISVQYDGVTRRLLRYEGPSNIRDPNGLNYQVRIDFEYGPPAILGEGNTLPRKGQRQEDAVVGPAQLGNGFTSQKVRQPEPSIRRFWM